MIIILLGYQEQRYTADGLNKKDEQGVTTNQESNKDDTSSTKKRTKAQANRSEANCKQIVARGFVYVMCKGHVTIAG